MSTQVGAICSLHCCSAAAVLRRVAARWRHEAVLHSWTKQQKTAKNKAQKFVKMTGHTHVCNSLTNFRFEANAIIINGNYLYLLKFIQINSWNDNRVTYFWWVIPIWNHCVLQPVHPREIMKVSRANNYHHDDTALQNYLLCPLLANENCLSMEVTSPIYPPCLPCAKLYITSTYYKKDYLL